MVQCLLENLAPSERGVLRAQIATIREEVRVNGQSVANCTKLLALCPDVSTSGQWGEIAKIAIAERWSFTFFANGDVCFANL
jgi:hypothetical protein